MVAAADVDAGIITIRENHGILQGQLRTIIKGKIQKRNSHL